ncbi:MAG: hypothetical protein RL238_3314 [Actinomycetota bacterium]|jgi:hypothetical protein
MTDPTDDTRSLLRQGRQLSDTDLHKLLYGHDALPAFHIAPGFVGIEDRNTGFRWVLAASSSIPWVDWMTADQWGAEGVLALHGDGWVVAFASRWATFREPLYVPVQRSGEQVVAGWYVLDQPRLPDLFDRRDLELAQFESQDRGALRRSGRCPAPRRLMAQVGPTRLGLVALPCERKSCFVCGPNRQRALMSQVLRNAGDHAVELLSVTDDRWPAVYERMRRARAAYIRIPQTAGGQCVLTTATGLGGRAVEDLPAALMDAFRGEANDGRRTQFGGAWKLRDPGPEELTGEADFTMVVLQHPRDAQYVVERLKEAGLAPRDWEPMRGQTIVTPEFGTPAWMGAVQSRTGLHDPRERRTSKPGSLRGATGASDSPAIERSSDSGS